MTESERRHEKLKNAVLYFVSKDKTVGLTKLMKLLFYLDFRLFAECGQSLSGQTYKAWKFGPVPADVWRELHDKQDSGIGLKDVVKIIPIQTDERDEAAGIRLAALSNAQFSDYYFTGRELKVLQEVSSMFMGYPASLVVEASHARNTPWSITVKKNGEMAAIDYELALAEKSDDEKEYLLEVDRDARQFEAMFA